MNSVRKFIRGIISFWKSKKSSWQGNYLNWQNAEKASSGYDDDKIVDKVLESTLKVKNGEAVFERDSVVFDKIEYSEPLLLALVLASRNGSINVLDVGGALGSHYFQNAQFLKDNYDITNISWNIVEQKKYIEIGKQFLASEELKFHLSIADYKKNSRNIDIIILSSVLAYIENIDEIIAKVVDSGARFIIIDRTLVLEESKEDIICVQTVPDVIYKASYPCRIFSKEKLISRFLKDKKYKVILDYKSNIDSDVYICNKIARSRGIILKKIGE